MSKKIVSILLCLVMLAGIAVMGTSCGKKDDGVFRLGEIGRASCRERVYLIV